MALQIYFMVVFFLLIPYEISPCSCQNIFDPAITVKGKREVIARHVFDKVNINVIPTDNTCSNQ
jgi:hypothetical protein